MDWTIAPNERTGQPLNPAIQLAPTKSENAELQPRSVVCGLPGTSLYFDMDDLPSIQTGGGVAAYC